VAGTAGTAIKYRVLPYVKVYDASVTPPTFAYVGMGTIATGPPQAVVAGNQFPAGCRSVSLWADRLVFCNNEAAPHVWWMSAAGDPNNHDYGDAAGLGSGAAVAGTQSEFAGLIGEPIVTTIPVDDDLLIFACKTSYYYLRGNPLDGGRINNITRAIGIVDIGAWCLLPYGRLFTLTPDGLYTIRAEPYGASPVSRNVLPIELLGLSSDLYETSLGYGVERREIIISAIPRQIAGTTATLPAIRYIYNVQTGAFFFDQAVSINHYPTAMVNYQPSGVGTPEILLGCFDGYVRRYENAAKSDDGTNFASNVLVGPVRLGSNDLTEGIIHQVVNTMDAASGNVTVNLYVGDTPQAALASAPAFTFTSGAGLDYHQTPRARGAVVYIEFVGTAGSAWVHESTGIVREIVGLLRKS